VFLNKEFLGNAFFLSSRDIIEVLCKGETDFGRQERVGYTRNNQAVLLTSGFVFLSSEK
jgi:hypothetical protein